MIAGKTSCQSSLGPSEHDLSGSMTLTIFQTGCNLVAQQSGPPDYTSFGTRAVATGTIHGNEIELSSGIGKRTDPMNGSCILTGPMDTLVGTLAGDRLDLADASIFENSCVYPISASIIRCTRDARVTASR